MADNNDFNSMADLFKTSGFYLGFIVRSLKNMYLQEKFRF